MEAAKTQIREQHIIACFLYPSGHIEAKGLWILIIDHQLDKAEPAQVFSGGSLMAVLGLSSGSRARSPYLWRRSSRAHCNKRTATALNIRRSYQYMLWIQLHCVVWLFFLRAYGNCSAIKTNMMNNRVTGLQCPTQQLSSLFFIIAFISLSAASRYI